MGGDINVQSRPGKGSIFRLDVRMERGEGPAVSAKPVKRRIVGIESGDRTFRILIVDDKEDNRGILRGLLTSVGFETREACNGQEAIEEAERWSPDLIVMDIRMPVMDGYEATRRIKSTEKGRNLPIIAVTASVFEDGRRLAFDIGIDGYVRKPFKEEELFETIGFCLGVQYVYEEEVQTTAIQGTSAMATVMPNLLADLPDQLRRQIHSATKRGDLDEVMGLIEEVAGHSAQAADYLRQLAANFEYDTLLKITEG